jgi:hypothetical protein
MQKRTKVIDIPLLFSYEYIMLLLSYELQIMRNKAKVVYCVLPLQHLSPGTELTSRNLN